MERWKYSYAYNHLQINQISVLNNPLGDDMPSNKKKNEL